MVSTYVIASLLFVSLAKLEYSVLLMVIRLTNEGAGGSVIKYFHENKGKIDMISWIVYTIGFIIFNVTYYFFI